MPNYKVSIWTCIEANNKEDAKNIFMSTLDENSIDIEEIVEPEAANGK